MLRIDESYGYDPSKREQAVQSPPKPKTSPVITLVATLAWFTFMTVGVSYLATSNFGAPVGSDNQHVAAK